MIGGHVFSRTSPTVFILRSARTSVRYTMPAPFRRRDQSEHGANFFRQAGRRQSRTRHHAHPISGRLAARASSEKHFDRAAKSCATLLVRDNALKYDATRGTGPAWHRSMRRMRLRPVARNIKIKIRERRLMKYSFAFGRVVHGIGTGRCLGPDGVLASLQPRYHSFRQCDPRFCPDLKQA